jgi:hypothetical protein
MDPLTLSVHNLTDTEFNFLKRQLKDQPRKMHLLIAVRKSKGNSVDYEALTEYLGYTKHRNAFYTLKHRLGKDLVDYRLSIGRNEYVKTKERIQGLRSLLYSRDHLLLEREARDLFKRCVQMEIVRGVYEIHFCEYLLFYHDRRKRADISARMAEALEREKSLNECEIEFYRIIFEFQDVFYHGSISDPDYHRDEISLLTSLHQKLDMRVTEFILLSAEMTFDLRLASPSRQNERFSGPINHLFELYMGSHIQFRFPNCSFAIECLFNKFYLITGNTEGFRQSLMRLEAEVDNIVGFKMYEDVLYYFLFARIHVAVSEGKEEDVLQILEKYFPDKSLHQYSERFLYYLNHLFAIALIYTDSLRKAEGRLLKSRRFSKFLEPHGFWVEIENVLLKLSIHIRKKEDEMATYELNILKRLLKRPGVRKELFSDFMQSTQRHIKAEEKKFAEYKVELNKLKKVTGLLYVLDVDRAYL